MEEGFTLQRLVAELQKLDKEYGPLEVLLEVDAGGEVGHVPVTRVEIRINASGGGLVMLG